MPTVQVEADSEEAHSSPPPLVAVKSDSKVKATGQVEPDCEHGQDFKVRHQFKLLISDVFQQCEPLNAGSVGLFLGQVQGERKYIYLAVCDKFNVGPKVKVQISKKE
eukprot:8584243-Pyramimonas_sp.AAC.1